MFAKLIRYRVVVIAVYAALLPLAILAALRIPSEGGLDRLIVPDDPDLAATRGFQRIFPEPQLALLVFEAPDPWAPEPLARIKRAEDALRKIPNVFPFSVLDALSRARPNATPAELHALTDGTPFFRQQGLVGDHFLTLIVDLEVHGPAERDAAIAAIEAAVGPDVHAVGAPFVTSWLEHQSSRATGRAFAVFGVLMIVVIIFLYRSFRTLLAMMVSLGMAVALAVAAGWLLGFTFTIVSALVPLTIMVTTLATLTYLQSRFVDQPAGVSLEEHHLASLRNKLLPVTASTVAAAAGFGALAVSHILPIRQMGIWTAVGLVISWCVSYTLFPALQRVLRTPTGRTVPVRSAAYDRVARVLPSFTYRHRKAVVGIAAALAIAGAVALVGIPGLVSPMPVRIDALSNIDPHSRLYRDMRWFSEHVMDLNVARVWVHLPHATATDPEVLHAIDRLQRDLEAIPTVTGVAGPTTPLRMRSYLAGHGDHMPDDPQRFADAVSDVETLMMQEPDLRTFIDVDKLSDFQIVVLFREGGAPGYSDLTRHIDAAWAKASRDPALAGAELFVVGEARLQAKIGADLVPTLAQSFALTAALIFIVFLVIFRSGTERLLAMIPSVFALLVTFLGLRLAGGALNVATILIATTVLGTTENDQLHFFHHMHEAKEKGTYPRLRHAFRVAGRAVVFATIINAAGFLGLATSGFPPLRQFGVLTAGAFVLALIAGLLVMPAALWLVRRDRPPADS